MADGSPWDVSPDECRVIGVDLAARYTASVEVLPSGEIGAQWDSRLRDHRSVADSIVRDFRSSFAQGPTILVIEDLPPRAATQLTIKNVSQIQGRVLQSLIEAELPFLFFVDPMLWERDMGVFRKPAEFWTAAALSRKYAAPDLLTLRNLIEGKRGQAGAVKEAKKQMTDYVAAFLIASWAREHLLRTDRMAHDSHRIRQYLY